MALSWVAFLGLWGPSLLCEPPFSHALGCGFCVWLGSWGAPPLCLGRCLGFSYFLSTCVGIGPVFLALPLKVRYRSYDSLSCLAGSPLSTERGLGGVKLTSAFCILCPVLGTSSVCLCIRGQERSHMFEVAPSRRTLVSEVGICCSMLLRFAGGLELRYVLCCF